MAPTNEDAAGRDTVWNQYQRRVRLEQEQPTLFAALRTVINRHDPIGLISDEAPEDEYEAEVTDILVHLPPADSPVEVTEQIYRTFSEWFDEDMAGGKEEYQGMAQDIWTIWKNFTGRTQT